VFLDETGTNTAMTRLYGRAPRGQRLVEAVPEARWQATTLISAIRRGGVVGSLVFKGATDEMAFRTYVEKVLVPALRPGDIVVLDDLAAHKVTGVARALRKAGAGLWYLPPYAPDLNPIEAIWSKVKGLVRKAKARTTEALWDAVGRALEAVTPQDCQGCFASCGYHATPDCKTL
jgi:transposase